MGDLSNFLHKFISLSSLLAASNECCVRLYICINFGGLRLIMCMFMNKKQG